ncbi:MAG: DNA replication/repair protein RecF [Firmicutes bacterium]|nr:DNA replication/repair protein RecF [Bacillota bacterium]
MLESFEMKIKSVALTNFRNHIDTTVTLGDGVNVFIGNNAQGKTNLLESIYLTCVGRGWRTNRDKDMINFDQDFARVKTTAEKSYGDVDVEIKLSKSEKKSIKINGIPIQKMGELMGQINCVFFSPDELKLVKEAPKDRRRFLDIDLSQIDKNYFYALVRYNKILAQRNALLKSASGSLDAELDIWDLELAKQGTIIINKRILFLGRLRSEVEKVHNFLTSSVEQIGLEYEGCVGGKNVETALLAALHEARGRDMRLRTTTVGPHRDDICILINGKDVRTFGSQGQQRTVALSIKLAELVIFKEETGEMPVLLLDDVLSELDPQRQERLFKAIRRCQSIITTANDIELVNIEKYYIKDGKIV